MCDHVLVRMCNDWGEGVSGARQHLIGQSTGGGVR